jgi:Pyruvate phosphate dikinase, AMP/ATP-binding domain
MPPLLLLLLLRHRSLRKCGIEADDVRMAVCVMRVVPARYAFVIHTRNPSNNDANEVFCELVKGLGESLVSGMVPGSSIAFSARKDALDAPQTLSYASKSEGMFVRESLIFRCDSGVDLLLLFLCYSVWKKVAWLPPPSTSTRRNVCAQRACLVSTCLHLLTTTPPVDTSKSRL